jgi:hypothetical protein
VDPLLEKTVLLLQPIEVEVVSVITTRNRNECKKVKCYYQNLQDPQLGSAITYYRRYTLQSLLGLQAEDDDGNKQSAPQRFLH